MNAQRRPLIAGNWKMNTSLEEAITLAKAIAAESFAGADVVVFPPFPWILPVHDVVVSTNLAVGAQDIWPKPNGAFTGGVSTQMLHGLVTHVIVGHSERRQLFGESDALVRDKVSAVLEAGMTPILCVGESLATRTEGNADAFVSRQLVSALGDRTADAIARCVIAYEPIWAIGTGVAASALDAERMSIAIRNSLDSLQAGVSQSVRVLYGGSVTPSNCAETLGQPNVDGALIGGASLKPETFLSIIRSIAD